MDLQHRQKSIIILLFILEAIIANKRHQDNNQIQNPSLPLKDISGEMDDNTGNEHETENEGREEIENI
ncbi:hypothetical protein RCL_jg21320.t1 [Rhizophagus clarus]|uniref:Uncharacterized protein n=1 Tax=Rhizophagus clarus TaxID=94130 RepID=A0A8H3LRJ3_9GLOM|nr:hypothetical protein RCL_jg21320.t1 [Rhizophagus clarus]